MPDVPMIEVRGITKFYGTFKALDEVSFDVAKGEVLGFLGPQRRRQIHHHEGADHIYQRQ
ncbi:MAG: hypothetical protein IPP14_11310 [Planctomycetes bacterium]|nr:hypothetical protein [Planctomycetota bacterium]